MEPTPPELGAATGSPRELIVESREELLYLLGEAAELEHSVPADAGPARYSFLYASSSLGKRPTRLPGRSPDLVVVRGQDARLSSSPDSS
jgi:hypothetical protein